MKRVFFSFFFGGGGGGGALISSVFSLVFGVVYWSRPPRVLRRFTALLLVLVFVFHYKWTWKWNCTERFKCIISKFQQWWRQTATSSLLLLSTTSGHSSRRPVLRQWRHDNQLLLQWIRHLLPYETWHCTWSVSLIHNIIGLVQERRNYSALAMELRLTICCIMFWGERYFLILYFILLSVHTGSWNFIWRKTVICVPHQFNIMVSGMVLAQLA